MKKIGDSTNTATDSGEWREGNPAAGLAATLIKADWLTTIQREMINVVLGAGLSLDKGDDSQLLKAIQAIQNSASTWAKLAGKPTTIAGFEITDAFTKTETSSAIQTAISALVASSPSALDTLKELANALGDDPNFATTMTNALASKASTIALSAKADKANTLVGYGILLPNQIQAEDGSDNTLPMTPLRVSQAIKKLLVAATESLAGILPLATTDAAIAGVEGKSALSPSKLKAILAARGLWDVSITGTTNANMPRSTGIYSLNGVSNGPPGGGAYQMFSTDWGADPTWQSQLALGISANNVYIRSIKKDQSAALPWDKLYSTADFVMVGASVGFYLAAPPVGWLRENGAAVSRTTYSALFAAIGTTYGAGDGATTFNLPDSRSLFSRAADDGKGIDTGRIVGSSQAQSIQSHAHAILQKASNFLFSAGTGGGAPGSNVVGSTEATGGAETRPANIAKLYCIKY